MEEVEQVHTLLLNGATRCLETQPLSDYAAALNSNYYCRRDLRACCVCKRVRCV